MFDVKPCVHNARNRFEISDRKRIDQIAFEQFSQLINAIFIPSEILDQFLASWI